MCDGCRKLLNQGLDLCVRARKLDAQDRTNDQHKALKASDEWVEEHGQARADNHNEMFPDAPIMARSATMHIWVTDQYETDLADWERRSRAHLTAGCKST